MEPKGVLEQIGIEGKKADIYLACLEMGGATAYLLAKKTGIKRPTAYDIINQLMKEGLVHVSFAGKIRHYSPADPLILLNKAKEREEKIEAVMGNLQNLYNSPKGKPFIRYFEGKEGIKEMYEDSLRSLNKGDEILAYVGESVLEQLPEYVVGYVQRRVEKGIVLKGIYKGNEKLLERLKNNQAELRQAKIINEKELPLSNETNIYKNKVAIANYGREMFGMLIESEEIYRSQKAIFNLLWNKL